jgi:hypothetical protein
MVGSAVGSKSTRLATGENSVGTDCMVGDCVTGGSAAGDSVSDLGRNVGASERLGSEVSASDGIKDPNRDSEILGIKLPALLDLGCGDGDTVSVGDSVEVDRFVGDSVGAALLVDNAVETSVVGKEVGDAEGAAVCRGEGDADV